MRGRQVLFSFSLRSRLSSRAGKGGCCRAFTQKVIGDQRDSTARMKLFCGITHSLIPSPCCPLHKPTRDLCAITSVFWYGGTPG